MVPCFDVCLSLSERKKNCVHAFEDRLYDQKHREGFLSFFLQNEMICIVHWQGLRRSPDGSRTNAWHLLLHLLINLLVIIVVVDVIANLMVVVGSGVQFFIRLFTSYLHN